MTLFHHKILKPKFWENNNSFIKFILLPFSLFYLMVFLIKKNLTSSYKYKVPIICVGNIYLGGTGKTPLSIYLFNNLKRGFRPAIIKKFYNSHSDEIKLIKNKVKNLFISVKRDLAINESIKKNFNLIIMDDGFQDFSIKKDCNIICFHSEQLLGNEMVLPAGPLREPLEGVKNADIIVINGDKKPEFEKKLKNVSNNIKIFYSKYKLNIKKLNKKKNYLAFAGIGNPVNFFNLLKKKNIKVKKTLSFPDHYNFSKDELTKICKIAEENKLEILTTEKDYLRIKRLGFKKINFVPISLEVANAQKLIKEIKILLQ